jgi:hypothetical protein
MSVPAGGRPPTPAPDDPGRLSPDQPVWEVDGQQRGVEEGHPAEPRRALVPGTRRRARVALDGTTPAGALPRAATQGGRGAVPAGAVPAPSLRQDQGRRSGRAGRLLATALALGLFAVGIGMGAMLAAGAREPARPAPAAATSATLTTVAPTTTAPARQVPPPACLSAVDDADAVISYLVTNTRDQRLARTLQQYRVASRACRRAS